MGVNPVSREVHIVIVSEKRQLSNPDNFSSLLLTLVALSGEFPASQSRRFSASETYPDFAVKRLKHDKLLRTYYNNGLRGLRLTAKAKKLLTADQPDQFTPLFVGDTMTSTPKYTIVHRLRLHRMAEVLVSMFNAGVTVFPWEKPIVFTPTLLDHAPYIDRPVYFSSCEVKNIGLMANKIRNSRSTGVLLTNDSIFAVYNTGASEMKWEHRAEIRLKSFLEIELCLHRLPGQFAGVKQNAIMFGADMDCLLPLMGEGSINHQNYFLSGESFPHFHYLTSDHYGDLILRLLCEPDEQAILNSILSQDLSPPQPGLVVENDAMDGDEPVLFAYTCDMPRIKRFDNALGLHEKMGTLYCFDFQEEALRKLCGSNVSIQTIDFNAYEGSVFHSA